MKSTGICPKCEGRKIYEVSAVQQTYCDAGGSLKEFHLTGAALPTGEKGVFGGATTSMTMAGPLAACVCAACGYVEWHLPKHALAVLERLGAAGNVRLLPPPAARDPFR
jgi:hypothetical protein